MSFDSKEASSADSQPIEIYDFFSQSNEHWRYTSAPDAQVFLGQDYSVDTVTRKAIEITENQFRNLMEVKLGRNNAFALQYIAGAPESKMGVSIYRLQGVEYALYWSGLVQTVTFDASGLPSVKATLNTASLAGVSKRRRCQILCDNALYDSGCRVNKEAYKVAGTILTVDGKTITATIFATKTDGWFKAGQLKIGTAYRLIKAHTGNSITITRPVVGAEIGNSFTAYAGCDHAATTCWSKFHNVFNSGDHRWLPKKNPISGIMDYQNQPSTSNFPSSDVPLIRA